MAQSKVYTPSWTVTQIQALEQACAQGVRTVTIDGRTVTYASMAEMFDLRDRMIRELNNQGDVVPPPNSRGSVFVRR